MSLTTPHPHPLSPPAGRGGSTPADREVIEALHDLADVLSAAIHEFSDPVDKAALLDGLQMIIDVAIDHDLRGNYGIFIGEDEEGGSEVTA